MKNIQLANLNKYKNNTNYELAEGNIYKDIKENHYVFALSYELEENEDSQYPLEDILDKFYLHVSDFIDEDNYYTSKNITLEIGGDLEDVKTAINNIIGKRVYNEEYNDNEGVIRVKLVIA